MFVLTANLRRRHRQNQQLTSIINGGDGPIAVYHISGNVNLAAEPPAYDEIVNSSSYLPAPPAYEEINSNTPAEPDPVSCFITHFSSVLSKHDVSLCDSHSKCHFIT